MNTQTMLTLEYEEIRSELMRYAVSYEGRRKIGGLEPSVQVSVIRRMLAETAEAKALLQKGASVPLPSLDGIEFIISLLGSGYLFAEQDFSAVARFLQSCMQLKKYMAGKTEIAPVISAYALSLSEESRLREEIERCIRNGQITDSASRELEKIRRKIEIARERIQKKMAGLLSKYAPYLQEHLVSTRDGRAVIPVRKEYYRRIKGTVLDQSTSGQTVFIEPDEIAALQFELNGLLAEESREEAKILAMLTTMLEASARELMLNIEITGTYDFLFAKGKYALAIGGNQVEVNDSGSIRVVQGKHPKLLAYMVPLDIEIGTPAKGLIITGPNTGGKTVVLKTLGLLTLMVQSGLLVPAGEESKFAVFRSIQAVIGDGQSLEQSLSTFSAQMTGLIQMLKTADSNSLFLIDELAAGTDPAEGMALSIAILEELSEAGAVLAVTTHFNELKKFAASAPGFRNARMEFDPVTLQPLYRLTLGEAGSSYALEIARRLGMAEHVIERSRKLVKGQAVDHVVDHVVESSPVAEISPAYIPPETIQVAGTPDFVPEPLKKEPQENRGTGAGFQVGDAVWITSLKRMGIIYTLADAMGMVTVQVQKQKLKINQKRLKPYIKKGELYPEDYDMDIVFDSKANRKLRKQFGKRHVEGEMIIKEEE